MADTTTPTLNLTKPSFDGPADIRVFSTNMDILDEHAAATEEAIDAVNPMTSAGDLIVGGAAGAPVRLAVGAETQALTVVGGVPVWTPPTYGGMTNPMTSPSDLIVGGPAGGPVRLGAGADGQVLGVAAGAVGWSAPASVAAMLTNGGFEVWQRGNGPFGAHGAYTADRWYLGVVGATLSISRAAQDLGLGSLYAASFAYTHGGAGTGCSLNQRIEGFEQLRGATVTFSVLVETNQPGSVRVRIYDGTTSLYSPYNAAAGRSTLAVTAAVPSAAPTLAVSVIFDALTCAGRVDNAVLVLGSTAPAYAPVHAADEWSRCQRYYAEIGGLNPNGDFVGAGYVVATTGAQVILRYPVEMAVAPTITIVNPTGFDVGGAAGNSIPLSALAVSSPSLATRRECRLIATVAGGLVAGNATFLRALDPTSRIRLEANP